MLLTIELGHFATLTNSHRPFLPLSERISLTALFLSSSFIWYSFLKSISLFWGKRRNISSNIHRYFMTIFLGAMSESSFLYGSSSFSDKAHAASGIERWWVSSSRSAYSTTSLLQKIFFLSVIASRISVLQQLIHLLVDSFRSLHISSSEKVVQFNNNFVTASKLSTGTDTYLGEERSLKCRHL